MRRNDLAVDATARSLLAVAAFAEERRAGTYQQICARACSALSAASIPFLVLKGAALADTVYPAPALRHSHDIDVLVHTHDWDRSAAAVRSAGFIAAPSHPGPVRFLHACGLPLELHVGVCRLPHYTAPLAEIWDRATRSRSGAAYVSALGAADHLVHVLGQASCYGSRDTLTWVCNVWYLISRTAEIDWDVILRTAGQSAAALALAGLIEFLAVQLRAPVPGFVLDGLSAAARGADRGRPRCDPGRHTRRPKGTVAHHVRPRSHEPRARRDTALGVPALAARRRSGAPRRAHHASAARRSYALDGAAPAGRFGQPLPAFFRASTWSASWATRTVRPDSAWIT